MFFAVNVLVKKNARCGLAEAFPNFNPPLVEIVPRILRIFSHLCTRKPILSQSFPSGIPWKIINSSTLQVCLGYLILPKYLQDFRSIALRTRIAPNPSSSWELPISMEYTGYQCLLTTWLRAVKCPFNVQRSIFWTFTFFLYLLQIVTKIRNYKWDRFLKDRSFSKNFIVLSIHSPLFTKHTISLDNIYKLK